MVGTCRNIEIVIMEDFYALSLTKYSPVILYVVVS